MDPRTAAKVVYGKPLEDWDDEELARGRARGADGRFPTGPRPEWLTEEIDEEIRKRFQKRMRQGLGLAALSAADVLTRIMKDDRPMEDEDGGVTGWLVSPSVRADIAKYLLDQVAGKATQPIDVSAEVKIQGLFASVVVNADGTSGQGSMGEEYEGEAEEVDPDEVDPDEADDA